MRARTFSCSKSVRTRGKIASRLFVPKTKLPRWGDVPGRVLRDACLSDAEQRIVKKKHVSYIIPGTNYRTYLVQYNTHDDKITHPPPRDVCFLSRQKIGGGEGSCKHKCRAMRLSMESIWTGFLQSHSFHVCVLPPFLCRENRQGNSPPGGCVLFVLRVFERYVRTCTYVERTLYVRALYVRCTYVRTYIHTCRALLSIEALFFL